MTENKKSPEFEALEKENDFLTKEVEYLNKVRKEQDEIIIQLMFPLKPREYTYIHPYDLYVLIKDRDFIDIVKTELESYPILIIDDVKYKQSTSIPALTNFFSMVHP